MSRRVYVDTSAALRRVIDDVRSPEARRSFGLHSAAADTLVSSALIEVEVARGVRARASRLGVEPTDEQISEPMTGITTYPIDAGVIALARTIGPDELRSLDAIHLATAVTVGADVVFTYDARLAAAARAWGLAVEPA